MLTDGQIEVLIMLADTQRHRAYIPALRELAERNTKCVWTPNPCVKYAYDRTCGGQWWCSCRYDPKENLINFCPNCGHPVQVEEKK